MQEDTNIKRAQFATRLGIIATTVGSAVGLGNIWRFPYECGSHGGAAFLLIYIGFIILLGIPMICAEFVLGRQGHANIIGTFHKLKPNAKWHWVGILSIVAAMMILSFYSVVAGWTLEYFIQSLSGTLTSETNYTERFADFSSSWRAVFWTVVFLAANYLVIKRGVQKGLERMSNIMMPILFLILLIFCINSLTLPKAGEGLTFLFKPDFSCITWSVVLSALGQAFFSLSIGLGCMLTYASYFNAKVNIVQSATITAGLDTLVAILAGIMIFPAVFTYGFTPEAEAPLIFEVLPAIFSQMIGGAIWSTLFFFMLFLASLSSTISMSEIVIAYLCDRIRMRRTKACAIVTGIAMVFGVLCALSFGPLKIPVFNIFNNVSSNILLPVGALVISIFTGWIIDKKILRDQLTNGGTIRQPLYGFIRFCIRYIAPAALLIIFIMCLIN